jgi:hypothetical protein
MKTSLLQLSEISTTAGTQVRASICADTVDRYAESMQEAVAFPPVIVFHDGTQYILADGFHRVMAATRNGFRDINAEVRKGTKSDALKFALGANAAHGLPRSNRDKRRSVELALSEWPKLSDRELAKICAVSHPFIAIVRGQLETVTSSPTPRIGADGKERKLPKKKESAPAPEPAPEPEPFPELPRIVAGPHVEQWDVECAIEGLEAWWHAPGCKAVIVAAGAGAEIEAATEKLQALLKRVVE